MDRPKRSPFGQKLIAGRDGEMGMMAVQIETVARAPGADELSRVDLPKPTGKFQRIALCSLPNDGKVIENPRT